MRILAVSDGRRGIENQALGLAEAVAREVGESASVATYVLDHGSVFAALPPSLQLARQSDFGLPDADLVVGCGRQAVAPLISLQRAGSPAFTVFVQDPRTEPSRFDLVVAPEHDGLDGPFVEPIIGSPNRVTEARIVTGTLAEFERLSRLSMPRAALMIGGDSRTHRMDGAAVTDHLQAANDLRALGHSLLITTSRRTPDAAQQAWEDFARGAEDVWLHTPDSDGLNPYFAFLGGADVLLVTEDSTNMLTEACTTGKPVFRLSMGGQPGKFAQLYARLAERCNVRVWDGEVDAIEYDPLDETERAAKVVVARMRKRLPGEV